jgi:FAD/FMN-containing dehydrogenase
VGVIDLAAFAEEVGSTDPVTITGCGTRGGPVAATRTVRAPTGIVDYDPAEMTLRCGAGTPMAEVNEALATAGQFVSLDDGGSVGGALATAASDLRRLGRGPAREALLQARLVTAQGHVAMAGGPTVKNVSGFDLCRLLVGSHGVLGFLGEVILRTRPAPAVSRWYAGDADPDVVRARLYRPAAVLWDGTTTWVCLEGHALDVAQQAALTGLAEVAGPPVVPPFLSLVAPTQLRAAVGASSGPTLAQMGVGVLHTATLPPPKAADPTIVTLHRDLSHAFDPTGRLNPGRFPLLHDMAAS